ncbi:MAG: nucleotide sugar dehydrogenase, partial [Lachnospiraceae bacterium]|nr:nucleotide sugar dehydrogenase [Lachnospiraceae bacterium]
MSVYKDIKEKRSYLALVGLGYVGMPIAVAFSEHVPTIGFDINKEKIEKYKAGKDPTNEVGDDRIKECSVEFTADESRLKDASFIIVAVPTPVKTDHTPDLSPVEGASHVVGRNLKKGAIVVYESTVY